MRTCPRCRRHAFATAYGRRFPFEKRRDAEPRESMELHLWMEAENFRDFEELEAGQTYWLAVTPPIALKSLPRAAGESGRSWITFVMRAAGR